MENILMITNLICGILLIVLAYKFKKIEVTLSYEIFLLIFAVGILHIDMAVIKWMELYLI